VQAAGERGLDFIAITDHNTTSHADAMRELQPYFDNLLLLPGREVTTFHGHANLFGSVAPLDFRAGSGDVPDWNQLLRNVERTGGIISINHPIRPSGEQCMGCGLTTGGCRLSKS
jgi:predicted metal-dependent phosphoesterase TrpH